MTKPKALPAFAGNKETLTKIIRLHRDGMTLQKIGERVGIKTLSVQVGKIRAIANDPEYEVMDHEYELAGAIAGALPARARGRAQNLSRDTCDDLMEVIEGLDEGTSSG